MEKYVHGYSRREAVRLMDQAKTLEELFHYDSIWPEGSKILEAGCGIGAQTKIIAPKNPDSQFYSIDISKDSILEAQKSINTLEIKNVIFQQANIFNLPFEENYFDHIFLCFVLEHLPNPTEALAKLKQVLKPGGTIMLIEGDHGSTYFHPDSAEAMEAVKCLVEIQKQLGGDANIGRKLFPILQEAKFTNISISPRMVYVDDSKPALVEGFTKNTFSAMIEGIAEEAVSKNLISKKNMQKGVDDLYRCAEPGGIFCYTFFKGFGTK
ncbi:MAG: methyltransferase domain-containing protein [Prolixibacteraceae bacterium]|nr:methyltransferase domain-containing protein [Prolixibacteraceae bacterium]